MIKNSPQAEQVKALSRYAYQQITGDSGAGALLGSFKGESIGGGFGLSWVPAALEGTLAITASWLRDLQAKRRLKADYASVSLAMTF
jgi:hypothetical protein